MKLTSKERQVLHQQYQGRCTYCGNPLGSKWHADHIEPVHRQGAWKGPQGYVSSGQLGRPERDTKANLTPACVPCNIDKSDSSLEAWRKRLERSHDILHRNYSTYRHALRLGVIKPMLPAKVVFYFETLQPRPSRRPFPSGR